MAWLSAHPRCSLCGSLLELESPERCPTCRSSIATVGQRTDFDDWGAIRRRGRSRFVWISYVLTIGVPMALASSGLKWLVRGRPPGLEDVAISACWLLLAYVMAAFKWRGAEQEFQQHGAARESLPANPPSDDSLETTDPVRGDRLSTPQ